jgi:hypothetical protein
MLQEEAPLPWRDAELRYVMKALGLEEQLVALPGTGESES